MDHSGGGPDEDYIKAQRARRAGYGGNKGAWLGRGGAFLTCRGDELPFDLHAGVTTPPNP